MVTGISVVIPNYNGVHLFNDTLPTVLEALQNIDKPSEIVVVDDCSSDGSVEYLLKNFPYVKVIAKKENGGFSATSNLGIASVTYDKVLLLNSDVKLTPTYFQHQLKYFDMPDTFGVMGRIVGWDDDKIQDGAKLPSFHGAKFKTSGNYLLENEADMQDGLYSLYLSGANAFMDKEKFLRIKGFNELFSPFSSEDVELSLRAWRLGFKCYYDYNSVCHHKVATSIRTKWKKKFVMEIYDRNKMYLNALHLDGFQKAQYYLQLVPETLGRVASFRWHYVTSLQDFVKNKAAVQKSRAEFDQLAKEFKTRKSLKEVADFILGSIKGKIVRL